MPNTAASPDGEEHEQDLEQDEGPEDSISLDLASNGRHDPKDLNVRRNEAESVFATTARTSDSNGCDLFSDSKDYDRVSRGLGWRTYGC